MVLFTEGETLLLLDLYLRLRERPQNVASNGVLLKAAARDQLTRAINKAGERDHPWSESQVFVKFKNLRNDYALVKWLEEQPGFRRNGERLTEEWWADIKAKRPKAHVFKGKLPWPFYSKMAMLVLDAPYVPVSDPRTARRISALLDDQGAEDVAADAGSSGRTSEPSEGEELHESAFSADTTNLENSSISSSLTPNVPSKRSREGEQRPLSQQKRTSQASERALQSPDERFERHESLAKSVEQCSAAAAGMAHGFQELVSVFQDQAQKCRRVEASNAPDEVLRGQRQVLMSIAKSLEQSTQATADMAKGYYDLVRHFIEESDAKRAQCHASE